MVHRGRSSVMRRIEARLRFLAVRQIGHRYLWSALSGCLHHTQHGKVGKLGQGLVTACQSASAEDRPVSICNSALNMQVHFLPVVTALRAAGIVDCCRQTLNRR